MMTVANGSRRITTREAQLKTAAVEVKALTISGKQVTLSVFRQLQNEDLLDGDSAELRGVPWGHVNYFWGDCKADHLHVVWQIGDELRRACVWRAAPEYDGHLQKLRRRLHALASYYVTWRVVRADLGYRNERYGRVPQERLCLAVNGRDVHAVVADWVDTLYGFAWTYQQREAEMPEDTFYHGEAERERQRWERLEAEGQGFGQRMQELGWQSPDDLLAAMGEADEKMQAFRVAWAQHYDALAALDQLFIAV